MYSWNYGYLKKNKLIIFCIIFKLLIKKGAIAAILTPILACIVAVVVAIAPIGIALIGCFVAFIPIIGTVLAIVLPIVLTSNSSNSG